MKIESTIISFHGSSIQFITQYGDEMRTALGNNEVNTMSKYRDMNTGRIFEREEVFKYSS